MTPAAEIRLNLRRRNASLLLQRDLLVCVCCVLGLALMAAGFR